MALTLVAGSPVAVSSAVATTVVFTTATTFGHTPATGNLVAVIFRKFIEDTTSEPTGDWTKECLADSTWGVGEMELWWRQIDGTEDATYTWTFGSNARAALFYEFNDSVAGTWVRDKSVPTTPGGTSVNSVVLTTTGALTQSAEVALAWMVANAALTNSPAVDSGFTLATGMSQALAGHKITAATTALVPTFSWGGASRSVHVGGQVTFYRTYGATVTAVMDAPLGALTATMVADQSIAATLAAPLGGLTASATAVVTHPATLAAPLGSATAAIAASVEHSAVLAAPLGSATGTITATTSHPATLAAPLGALTAAAVATPDHPAVLAAPLGGLSAAAAATVSSPAVTAVLDAPLGSLVATLVATPEHPAVLAAPLGELLAGATATVTHLAILDAPLGGLVGTIDASSAVDAVFTAPLGGLVAVMYATATTTLVTITTPTVGELVPLSERNTPRKIRQGRLHRHFGALQVGKTIVKADGEWRAVRTPTQDVLAAAEHAFLGGHVYEISNDLYLEMVDALPEGDRPVLVS